MAALATHVQGTPDAISSTLLAGAAPRWLPPACRRRQCCSHAVQQPCTAAADRGRRVAASSSAAAASAFLRASSSTAAAARLQHRYTGAARQQAQRGRPVRMAAGSSGRGSGGADDEPAPIGAAAFLGGGTAANAAMAAAGVALGDLAGLDVSGQLLHSLDTMNAPAALAYMLPLLAACYAGVAFADRLEGFGQLRSVFKTALIPQLRILPFWGLGLLALGAGVGEETLFRAFMQEAVCGGIAGAAPGLPAAATTAAGVAVSSVVFGWLHALTPTYFLFATGAGVLFGIEYVLHGLPTAAVTHWIYNWIALAFILRQWGGSSGAEEAG